MITHIKQKLCGYKHQDIIKKKYNEELFVSYADTIELLINHKLKMILKTNYNNKDLGILLFLTALTTTSNEAALSLEYLQQTNFI